MIGGRLECGVTDGRASGQPSLFDNCFHYLYRPRQTIGRYKVLFTPVALRRWRWVAHILLWRVLLMLLLLLIPSLLWVSSSWIESSAWHLWVVAVALLHLPV